MALITTPGAADADSYATLAEATAYHASRLHSSSWAALANDAVREAAMKWATRVLDAYPRCYTGAPVDDVQALGWPRSGMLNRNGFPIPTSGPSSIPKELKNAQIELAFQLSVADLTANNSVINQGITSIKAGSVAISFADLNAENSLLVARSIRELNALMAVLPDAVKYLLVPSWLLPDPEDASEVNSLVFEVL